MLEDVTAEDLAGSVQELLAIQYSHRAPRTRWALAKLLRGRAAMTFEVRLAPHDPVVAELATDSFEVTTGSSSRADVVITIPFRDVINLLGGKVPLRSLFRGRIGVRGSIRDLVLLALFFHIEVGDPITALGYFRHYFLDE